MYRERGRVEGREEGIVNSRSASAAFISSFSSKLLFSHLKNNHRLYLDFFNYEEGEIIQDKV